MDAFRSIISGVRFDKTRHKETFSKIRNDSSSAASVSPTSLVADIFGQSNGKVESSSSREDSFAQTSAKKNKKKSTSSTAATVTVIDDRTEEEINAFRNRMQIKVKGEGIPPPEATFQQMNVAKEIKSVLLRNIELSYWKEPTPIQMQAIPIQLKNRDILAAAPTGSGKTAAYTIPLLSKLAKEIDNATEDSTAGIKAVILAPTKELADQIDREVCRLKEGKKIKVCNLRKNIVQQATRSEVRTLYHFSLSFCIFHK